MTTKINAREVKTNETRKDKKMEKIISKTSKSKRATSKANKIPAELDLGILAKELAKILKGGKLPVKFNKLGNVKLGKIWGFSKLAGNKLVGGLKGTCGKYCEGCYNPENPHKSDCYAVKDYAYRRSVVIGHVRNTLSFTLDLDESFEILRGYLKRRRSNPGAIRINTSGELESVRELKLWFRLAEEFPELPFYIYTKAYDIVDETLKGTKIPDNFFLNISIWHTYGLKTYNKWKHLPNVRAFVYDDGYKYNFKMDATCPAYITGKLNKDITCAKCGICFSTENKVCSCHDH